MPPKKRPASAGRAPARQAPDIPYKILENMFSAMSTKSQSCVRHAVQGHELRFSSACSGSGMPEAAHAIVSEKFGKQGRLDFGCETSGFKRKFLQEVVHNKLQSNPGCLFHDICQLGSGRARCAVHGAADTECTVPRESDIFVCGFSCKDLSKKKSLSQQGKSSILRDAAGTTGTTFEGVRSHVGAARPRVVVLEQVKEIDSTSTPDNIDYLWDSFADLGYFGESSVFKSYDFYIPQSRERMYFVLVDSAASSLGPDGSKKLAKTILEFTTRLKSGKPFDLGDFLLGDEEAPLTEELARRSAAALGDRQAADWRELHRTFLRSKGYTWKHVIPSQELAANDWFKTLPSREREILSFALHRAEATPERQLCMVDLGPRIDRGSISWDSTSQTLTPGSKLWIHTVRRSSGASRTPSRILLGQEMLRLQGFPVSWVGDNSSCSDLQLADLAGNAITFSVYLAIHLSILIHVDFKGMAAKSKGTESTPQHMSQLISEMGLLANSDDEPAPSSERGPCL